MKITNVNHLNLLPHKEHVKSQKDNATEKEKPTPAAIYEKSKPEDKGFIYDKVTIEQLKKDSERHYENLIRIVEDLLKRQGMSLNKLTPQDIVNVDEATRAKAAEQIGPDGPLGVEALSESIVDFAKAISGGDKSKLAMLKDAIKQGFDEAKKILGELPEISRQTFDRVMEKLDMWENE